MEGREIVAPRTETAAPPGFEAPMAMVPAKKKRGRPRKYGPDGAAKIALSPVIDFSAEKLEKVKPASKNKCELENSGEWAACSVGANFANFTPHIITVNTGEDVTMKIISFSQQGPRAICVISANGVISSVTLRQPDSSGGTLTYEGCFEILTLSGSFMPSDNGGTRSRSGGMSVSLVGPDGRVVGGGLAGLLVAASPVQVLVGSFLAGNQHEQNPKKQKHESISMSTIATAAIPISSAGPRVDLSSSSPFRGDNWSSVTLNKPTDINISFQRQSP